MDQTEQIKKIQQIMAKPDNGKPQELKFSIQEKIDGIINWSSEHDSFDLSFIESIERAFATYGKLTKNQTKAVDNIISGHNIEIQDWIY